jgi:hypothetical protein
MECSQYMFFIGYGIITSILLIAWLEKYELNRRFLIWSAVYMQIVCLFEIVFAVYFISMLIYLADFVGDTLKCSRISAITFISFSMATWIGMVIVTFSETGIGILV